MRKRSIFLILFLMALLDSFIAYVFPVDFMFLKYSFVPHLCFMTLLLFMHDKETLTRILVGILCGVIYDFAFGSVFPTSVLLFPLFTWLIAYWDAYFDNDLRWLYIGCVVFAFFLDFIPFIIYFFASNYHVPIFEWILHTQVVTVAINIVVVFVQWNVLNRIRHQATKRASRKGKMERRKYRSIVGE